MMKWILQADILLSYFGMYSPFAKAYRTQGGDDQLFQEVANFLLEVAYVNPHSYHMPKQKVGFIIATYEGENIDWGYITGITLQD